MRPLNILTTLIITSTFGISFAGQLSFNIDDVVDIQTKDGSIVPVSDIIEGHESIGSVSISNQKLIIDSKNSIRHIADIQLSNGKIINFADRIALSPGGGGDIGGGGNK